MNGKDAHSAYAINSKSRPEQPRFLAATLQSRDIPASPPYKVANIDLDTYSVQDPEHDMQLPAYPYVETGHLTTLYDVAAYGRLPALERHLER
jgi:hypothetical protein